MMDENRYADKKMSILRLKKNFMKQQKKVNKSLETLRQAERPEIPLATSKCRGYHLHRSLLGHESQNRLSQRGVKVAVNEDADDPVVFVRSYEELFSLRRKDPRLIDQLPRCDENHPSQLDHNPESASQTRRLSE
eukprot:CFRG4290T1